MISTLIGKVTLDFLKCYSNPILLPWITLKRISYIYQLNLHLWDFFSGEKRKHHKFYAPDGELGNGLFKMRTRHLSLYIFVGCTLEHPSVFLLFICFASSHYYSSVKHLILLLPNTTPRNRSWSRLWKLFQTAQSHPSDCSQLSYYKTKIVQTSFVSL